MGYFSTLEDTVGMPPFFNRCRGSTIAKLAVEVSQAELEELFEREGAGEPDSYPPGVSRDHCADLKQPEPDGANLSTSQFRRFETKPAQRFQ